MALDTEQPARLDLEAFARLAKRRMRRRFALPGCCTSSSTGSPHVPQDVLATSTVLEARDRYESPRTRRRNPAVRRTRASTWRWRQAFGVPASSQRILGLFTPGGHSVHSDRRLLGKRHRAALWLGVVGLIGIAGCGGGASPSVPGVSVPVGYQSYFAVASRRCPGVLTPAGLAAQAYVESSFQPNAVSAAGAEGLLQITPAIWRIYGTDANGDGRADPFTPADSIATAAKFDCVLAGDVRNIPGDPTSLWLAAYNAGVNAVRQAGGIPPFAETEQYIQQVKQWTVAFGADFTPSSP